MKAIDDLTVLIADHGRFFHVAQRIARDVKKVYYWSPVERDCQLIREWCVGDGFPDVTAVESIWSVKDQCDLFVFPDIGFSALQEELISQGYPVWGARRADSLEISRGKFLEALSKTDLPQPTFEKIIGLTNLRLYLDDKEDKWIKVSRFRGDWETLHWTTMEQDEGTLDGYAVRFGPLKELMAFYVFDPIETEIEDGIDSYCIDGNWPETVLHGMESKDKAYLGHMQRFDECPEPVRKVNEAFGPILADYGYRGFFSTEVRIAKDGQGYFIDPTCRCGSPPSQIQQELFGNYTEILWHGAHGKVVEPEPTEKFGVQALVSTDGDRSEWIRVALPDELRPWLKCGFVCQVDGSLVFPPLTEYHTSELGYLCAVGDTIQEAIDSLAEKRDMLPEGTTCEFRSLADLLIEVKQAEEKGIEFSAGHEVPDPAIVLDT